MKYVIAVLAIILLITPLLIGADKKKGLDPKDVPGGSEKPVVPAPEVKPLIPDKGSRKFQSPVDLHIPIESDVDITINNKAGSFEEFSTLVKYNVSIRTEEITLKSGKVTKLTVTIKSP